jgi:signal transduction histidine kinase
MDIGSLGEDCQALLTSLPIGIAIRAAGGGAVFVNPAFCVALGLPPGSIPQGAIIPIPDGRENTRPSGAPAPAGFHFITTALPTGAAVTCAVQKSPGADRVEMLESLLACIPQGICVFGPDQRVAMFNHAYQLLMQGVPVAVGDHLTEILRRRAAAGEFGPGPMEDVFAREAAHDVAQPQLRRRRRPNGMAIDIRTAPMPDGGHVSVVTDITPLTEAEQALSQRAAETDVMLASAQHGILLWSAERTLLAGNGVAAKLLGVPAGLLAPGRSLERVVDELLAGGYLGDGREAGKRARNLKARDRTRPTQFQFPTPAGRLLEIRSEPVPDGGFVVTLIDMTEPRRAQAELLRAKEAAEAANEAKSRFLAAMSHELRTPLNAVIGFSDLLLRETTAPERTRIAEFAQEINDAGQSLLGLVNVILDVARLESGRFDFNADRVDLVRLARSCLRRSDAAAQAAEISLLSNLPERLPLLRGDERRLAQVLNQLLSNALRFTPAGGTVTLSGGIDESGEMVLTVADTGIGIAPEDLERVFEPFTQLDGTLARRSQGTGLGLYLARALITGHGGRLALVSRVGKGSVAEIRLPADRLVPAEQENEA